MRIRSALALHKAHRLAVSGRAPEAVECLGKTYSEIPDPRLLIQSVRIAGSREDRGLLISRHPDNGSAMLISAISAMDAGDYPGATLAATNGLSARPGDPSLLALLMIARFRSGAEPMDWAELRESVKNSTRDVKAVALQEVERAILRLSPSDCGALEKDDALGGPAGFILDRLDDLAAIMGWMLSNIVNLISNAADSGKRAVYRHVIEGDRLAGQRRKDEAAAQFEKALQADPACVEALESLSRYYVESGDVERATSLFTALEKALASAGEGASPHLSRLRADISFFNGKFKEAVDLYEGAVILSPHDHMAQYRRGLCHLQMNDERKSAESFKRVLSMPNAGLLEDRFDALAEMVSRI